MLEITTLGNFKLKYQGKELTSLDFNSEVLIKLIVYMAVHRDGPVDSFTMANELWAEDASKNPTGALKNLFYRARVVLREHFPDTEFFISSRGSYRWNSEIECSVDVERMSNYANHAAAEKDEDKKEFYLRKVFEIYEGDFLSEIKAVNWLTMHRTYFHTLYLNVVKLLMAFYYSKSLYDNLNKVCNKALEIDRLEEEIYYYKIMVCVCTENLNMGLTVYDDAKKLLAKELGINTFSLLDNAYEKLLLMDHKESIVKIADLKTELILDNGEGPVFCGYTIFKEMYRIQARQRTVLGYAGILLLFSVDFSFDPNTGKIERYRAKRIMNMLADVFKYSLRRGDVVSKYSDYQYVVMLNGCPLEDAGIVIGRINDNFTDANAQYPDAKIKCQVEKIDNIQ